MSKTSYIPGLLASAKRNENFLTDEEMVRVDDIILRGAKPLTRIEEALVTSLSGKIKPTCEKEAAGIDYVKTIASVRLTNEGEPWKSDSERVKESLKRKAQIEELSEFRSTIDSDEELLVHLSGSKDENEQELSRIVGAINEAMEEVDAETERLLRRDCREESSDREKTMSSEVDKEILRDVCSVMLSEAEELERKALDMLGQATKMKMRAQMFMEQHKLFPAHSFADFDDDIP